MAFLAGAHETNVDIRGFRDGFFPYDGPAIKAWFEDLKSRPSADVIFTHARHDLHQDHREISNLTWQTFRDHLILEYEIPKWDGDLAAANAFVPISEASLARKISLLEDSLWFAAKQSLVRCRHISGSGAAAWNGVPIADALCRGLLRPQAPSDHLGELVRMPYTERRNATCSSLSCASLSLSLSFARRISVRRSIETIAGIARSDLTTSRPSRLPSRRCTPSMDGCSGPESGSRRSS